MSPLPAHLVEVLRNHAARRPEALAHKFLVDGEREEDNITYGALEADARSIAVELLRRGAGNRPVLLFFAPGLSYIRAFWGCLFAGAIAVPVYPPAPGQLERVLARLRAIVKDSRPAVVLTSADVLAFAQSFIEQDSTLAGLTWVAIEDVSPTLAGEWRDPGVTSEQTAFLQYTSGSTGSPKGVTLAHSNLIHNCELIAESFEHTEQSILLAWLPPYHDMGLIGGILHPLYMGFPSVLMSPMHFLQKPLRWLRAISAYRATTSGGPNFGFELCARKVTPEQVKSLDLSSWRVAFNGAEPIRAETLQRFSQVFGPAGFDARAFFPCYGLAEATLIVSGGPVFRTPPSLRVDATTLKQERKLVPAAQPESGIECISSGQPIAGNTVRIVDPETGTLRAPGEVGEIWVSGGSVAKGYWHQPEQTREIFEAQPVSADGAWLRTGDLGALVEGELYVLGRIKDLIIIDGANHAPQDIELTVERSDDRIRPGCCAAFSIEEDQQEKLVIVYEIREGISEAELPAVHQSILGNIRRAVSREHNLRLHDALVLEPRSIPKTSSGKLQRFACRQLFERRHEKSAA